MPAPEGLPGLNLRAVLKSIGVVVSECVREGKETAEVRSYISSLGVGVKRFAHAVRSHWGIEDSCHWSLDVTYRENFAWLNRFTLSLLKQHPGCEGPAMKRRSCG